MIPCGSQPAGEEVDPDNTVSRLDAHFPTEHQGVATPSTQIPPPLPNQAMALCREREITVGAGALVDVAGHATAFDVVGVAAVGRQFVHAAHDQLPLFTVGLDAVSYTHLTLPTTERV